MATATQDEGFHEIQLNGKQLVFLFMAATVVLVVSFLWGVQVGRNVQTERGPLEVSSLAPEAATAPGEAAPAAAGATAGNGATAPPSTAEDLTYGKRLSGDEPRNERLDTPEPPPVVPEADSTPAPTPAPAAASAPPSAPLSAAVVVPPPPAVTPKPDAKPAAAVAATTTAPPAAAAGRITEPVGTGFAIQVAGLSEAGEADTYARRLSAKGFNAYVVAPVKGTGKPIYRVRVGKFKQRSEADRVAARLAKEEKIKPWVLR